MIRIDGQLVSPGAGGVYNERMVKGYRVWDPFRSKLAALCMLDETIDLTPSMRVLYLGAANGTTVSHVADYVEVVYAVEFAPRPLRDLLVVAEKRENIVPIAGDATRPDRYAPFLEEVDLLYQDVAQPDQAGILIKHLPFLKRATSGPDEVSGPEQVSGGAGGPTAILMLKTRSVDIRMTPEEVFSGTVERLREAGLLIHKTCWLEPYHHDHAAIVCGIGDR
ncbi:MAG: fibrillarin-like rRNA/tRNA 2'-O-methyltransferase [Methanocalculus sp. MSAO_Arc1]|uniref:fibrillarin-like rRNA/tRNA 2'-O-methyltransferase n=1 Tax=Methanocalculus TaxID=71151 RepID=UPI000FF0090D|nr:MULTISPECIES: fibrillarin-like rRNA/tRNA 2'-O-methyltransferase [unclassified Methanocalculus]MCP1662958.1 fibrillarin-like pre-rRNA processing protein [Methanocalculus sp. AMF5]RQD81479.1 MAG: fibrillarin-like rRNA/tRNA 2'-O-methyltransferase [Methanocalculus sp. MSAO_Arc1]